MSTLVYPGELACAKCQNPVLKLNKLIVLGKTEYTPNDFEKLDGTALEQEDIYKCQVCSEFFTLNNLLENNAVPMDAVSSFGSDPFSSPAGIMGNRAIKGLVGCGMAIVALALCYGLLAIFFL